MTATIKTTPFDAAEYLDTDDAVAAFLADALEAGDTAVFQEALQTAARARGMTEIARKAELGRESLYKALQPGAQPRFATVQKVMSALGVRLQVSVEAGKPLKRVTAKAVKTRSGVIRATAPARPAARKKAS